MFVVLSAWIDAEHINDSDYIEDHKSRWMLRFVFVLACGGLVVSDTIGCGIVFIALFDNLLNKFRNLPLFYFGSVAIWDKFWSNKTWLYKMLVFVSLILGVTLIIC